METVVNQVGVNVNTASPSLLSHVAGLNKSLAQNVVKYREENGALKTRAELKKSHVWELKHLNKRQVS